MESMKNEKLLEKALGLLPTLYENKVPAQRAVEFTKENVIRMLKTMEEENRKANWIPEEYREGYQAAIKNAMFCVSVNMKDSRKSKI
jgi:hypothetical protein